MEQNFSKEFWYVMALFFPFNLQERPSIFTHAGMAKNINIEEAGSTVALSPGTLKDSLISTETVLFIHAFLHTHASKLASKLASKFPNLNLDNETIHAEARSNALVATIQSAMKVQDSCISKSLHGDAPCALGESDKKVKVCWCGGSDLQLQAEDLETENESTKAKANILKDTDQRKKNKKQKKEKKKEEGQREKKAETKENLEEQEAESTQKDAQSKKEEMKEEISADTSIADESMNDTPVPTKKRKGPSQGERFQRVKSDQVQFLDDRLKDMSYEAKSGAGDWGARANADLIKTRGKGFTKEKNKKKRGSYRGGTIDQGSHSIKFTYDDE